MLFLDLEKKLSDFVEEENFKFIAKNAEVNEETAEERMKEWENAFKEVSLKFNHFSPPCWNFKFQCLKIYFEF